MYCPHCGKENSDSAKFCKHCGQSVAVGESTSASVTPAGAGIDYLWGYRFPAGTGFDLPTIQASLEKKKDYKLIEHQLVKDDVFVYQKGDGKKSGVVIMAKVRDEIFILGNEKGLMSIRSRYINKRFKKPTKSKLESREMTASLRKAVSVTAIPQGSEKDVETGVGGWLVLPILNFLILYPIVAIMEMFNGTVGFIAVIDTAVAAYMVFAAIQLMRLKPGAPRHAKLALGANVVSAVIAIIYVASQGYDPDSQSNLYSNMTRVIIWSLVWMWYFAVSKRVKATYSN